MNPELPLRTATEADLNEIVRLERGLEAQRYVGQWSEDRHRATLTGGDARYLVVDDADGGLAAYAILRGLAETGRAVELKRVVVGKPERGLGRRLLTELVRIAFEELQAHRLFLDVFDDNVRAQHLYTSLGFVLEGTMRHAASRDGQWHDLRLMSMLESEYRARQSQPAAGA
jgi:RimJ/RimL family protein N-acetyltransferase